MGGIQNEKGKFLAQQQVNPQGQHNVDTSMVSNTQLEHLKSIITLRSGKEIDRIVYPNPAHIRAQKSFMVSSEKLEPLSSELGNVSKEKGREKVPCLIPAPFPQRLWLPKKGTTNAEIYKLFEKVKVIIPLLDAIKQITTYDNFLKNLCMVKLTMQVQKKAFLMEQASSIIQTMIAPKYKDLGCPTIAIVIWATRIEHTKLDLGVSFNLLPYSVYQ